MSIQHILKQGYLHALLLPCLIANLSVSAQSKQDVLQLLWQGLGGQEAWQEARFFMFSCQRNDEHSLLGEHSYLWDRTSANCRFEGFDQNNQKLIALFNTKEKTGKVYVNNKALQNPDSSQKLLKPILAAFYKETFWLFPPNLIRPSRLNVKEEALIGSTKYYVVEVPPLYPEFGEHASEWYIDTKTGHITRWQTVSADKTKNCSFILSGIKDVGGGLLLATSFIDAERGIRITYPIVSSLINVDEDKFKKP